MMSCYRQFNPVGQGGFYEEFFDDIYDYPKVAQIFRTVYDCGSFNEKRLYNIINNKGNGNIDILFISHFDYDHVGGIPHLCAKNKINNIVVPLLDNTSRILFFLQALNKGSSRDVLALIIDPIKYFREYCGDETTILSVEPHIEGEAYHKHNYRRGREYYKDNEEYSDEQYYELEDMEFFQDDIREDLTEREEQPESFEYLDDRYFSNKKDSFEIYEEYFSDTTFVDLRNMPQGHVEIESGKPLILENTKRGVLWKWVPFNFNSKNVSSQVEKDIEKLLRKYSVKGIDLTWIVKNLNKTLRYELNQIYKSYNKHITNDSNRSNTNSLVVYSGPENDKRYNVINSHIVFRKYNTINSRPGFLFCGDYNAFNSVCFRELESFYKPLLRDIGGIQIPHHGSITSYNCDLAKDIPIAVISAGKEKVMFSNHPHPNVLKHLKMRRNRKVVVVSDVVNTRYTQTIWI